MKFPNPFENFFNKNSQQPIKSRSEDPLVLGGRVAVQRSDGTLDSDFKITSFDHKERTVTVQKEEGEQVTTKIISIEELEKLNPPKLK